MKNIVFVILFISSSLLSQEFISVNDTINSRSYDYLQKKSLYALGFDKYLALQYSNCYLQKAKNEDKKLQILVGHHLLSLSVEEKDKIKHLDSLIELSKEKPTNKYPAAGYYLKGNYYYTKVDYKKAFDNYISANEILSKQDESKIKYETIYNIGILKERIDDNEGALDNFRKIKPYIEKENYNSYKVLFAMAITHAKLNQIDSADYYNKVGLKLTKETNSSFYNYMRLSNAIVDYARGNYIKVIDSLKLSLDYFERNNDIPNQAFVYYYKGISHINLGDDGKGIQNLKRVDSIFDIVGDVHPELRKSWEILIDYYSVKKEAQEELRHVRKLLVVDSILNSNYRYLYSNITSKYDVPILLEKRDELINNYQSNQRNFFNLIVGLCFLLLLGFVSFAFYRKKEKEKVLNYKKIIDQLTYLNSQSNKVAIKKRQKDINLKEEIINTIKIRLSKLEKEEFFLNRNIKIGDIAKKMGTNNKYLSTYINHFYGKNFNQYINDMRIEYATKKLKNDLIFRKWTLTAIANEIGFNSREYFANAFYKYHKIKPLFFIKKLQQES